MDKSQSPDWRICFCNSFFGAGSRRQALVLSSLIQLSLPRGRRASFGSFGRSKLSFLDSVCGILLRKTETLEGPQQPNWCQLRLATDDLALPVIN
ncbi:hypothetical protein [Adhaeribacter pallidiroseus]|uniref:hypothetical protein n=1 Tax=Adhaeribacter pallidiroseus TaxID=2072847 RepID=UPI0011C040D8|nr:hypothetical protein [Adhaeribacter pallidiroseus]